ncbi:phage portal protein [Desulfosarcina variabilis]|uniref:phage portal protein n=1 Tax=Desulfosarcina variabilis TaxID=2300 RepID=UPI003AFB7DE8
MREKDIIGIPAVYACVRVLAESIASLPLITYERTDEGKDRARGFSLYGLLHDQPNPLMTSFELRELMVGHLCLRGNAYFLIERDAGEVTALWPLHPDKVHIDVKGRDLVYVYQGNREIRYQADDILHVKGLSSDGIMGLSPIAIFKDTFGNSKAASDYSANYFKNDASPGGILTTPARMGPEASENLRKAWNAGHRGRNNHHRVAILDNDLKWQSIGISPQDSQMIESLKFSVVEIARIFRVPLNLVMDYERSTYSNVTEQNRSFLVHTLQPWLTRIEQVMAKSLLTASEKKSFLIEHKTEGFLRADTKTRYEAYEIGKRAGFLTTNEIRAAENMNPIDGGDEIEADLKKNSSERTRGIDRRDQISAEYHPRIRAAAAEIVNQEASEIRQAITRGDLAEWLENFYQNEMPAIIDEAMGPVLRSFALDTQAAAEIEVEAVRADLSAFIAEHISHYSQGHISSSTGQISSLLEDGTTEDVETRVDEWTADDHRAGKIADDQTAKTSNLIFAEVAFGAGYLIRSVARGKSCPWCKQLDGKIIGRGGTMLDAGEWTGSNGKKMAVRRPKITPPYHRGCDCTVTHIKQ